MPFKFVQPRGHAMHENEYHEKQSCEHDDERKYDPSNLAHIARQAWEHDKDKRNDCYHRQHDEVIKIELATKRSAQHDQQVDDRKDDDDNQTYKRQNRGYAEDNALF